MSGVSNGGGAERRKYRRVPFSVPLRYRDRSGVEQEARTIDVSPFGLMLDCPTALPEDGVFQLTVEFRPGEPPIHATCIVTRVAADGKRHRVSVAFINLTLEDFLRLKDHVDAHPHDAERA